MENREQRPRRTFTPEFKAEVVELCRAGDRSIAQVARDLGLNQTTVRNWVNPAAVDAGVGDGVTSAERDEIARLRKEVRVLREDRDILKRATAFFAKETR
ncbi:MAG: transposase [Actinomycetota bacterium]